MARDATSGVVRRGRRNDPKRSARSMGEVSVARRHLAMEGSGRASAHPDPMAGRGRGRGSIATELTKAKYRNEGL
jgi:hypothetical protein